MWRVPKIVSLGERTPVLVVQGEYDMVQDEKEHVDANDAGLLVGELGFLVVHMQLNFDFTRFIPEKIVRIGIAVHDGHVVHLWTGLVYGGVYERQRLFPGVKRYVYESSICRQILFRAACIRVIFIHCKCLHPLLVIVRGQCNLNCTSIFISLLVLNISLEFHGRICLEYLSFGHGEFSAVEEIHIALFQLIRTLGSLGLSHGGKITIVK